MLASPTGLAVVTLHDVFIADSGHDRVLEVSPSGVVTVIAGGHGRTDLATSAGHSSELLHPTGVAVDPTGAVYISDTYGNRLVEVHSDGTVTNFAGTGKRGFSGDGGPAMSAGSTTRRDWPWMAPPYTSRTPRISASAASFSGHHLCCPRRLMRWYSYWAEE
jgi:DNA-binding beta-propeller fold protein YncE